ncbi:hypothetical protein C8J56DRAFT_889731 [Mycena floridula]|nr:hypothetical protein C8J56DRAFT_889731 [Mycena floridula]
MAVEGHPCAVVGGFLGDEESWVVVGIRISLWKQEGEASRREEEGGICKTSGNEMLFSSKEGGLVFAFSTIGSETAFSGYLKSMSSSFTSSPLLRRGIVELFVEDSWELLTSPFHVRALVRRNHVDDNLWTMAIWSTMVRGAGIWTVAGLRAETKDPGLSSMET